MRTKGFTLIELLIVVAIIAILAAIAIPNFLEARTRAKVARVQGELRNVGTALEVYNMDHGFYPMDYKPYDSGCFPPRGPSDPVWDFDYLLFRLTTPIAYMSALPVNDPFNDTPLYPGSMGKYFYVNDAENEFWNGCLRKPPRIIWQTKENVFGDRQFIWLMKSVGPNQRVEWWAWPELEVMYDSSNGTISNGEIERCGP